MADISPQRMVICIILAVGFELLVLLFAEPKFPDVASALIAAVFAACAFAGEFRRRRRPAVLLLLSAFTLFCGFQIWRQQVWYNALPPGYSLKWESYRRLFR